MQALVANLQCATVQVDDSDNWLQRMHGNCTDQHDIKCMLMEWFESIIIYLSQVNFILSAVSMQYVL